MSAFLGAAAEAMEAAEGRDLARLLYALAKLDCTPSAAWLDGFALRLHAQLAHMAAADVVLAARALAQMRAGGAGPQAQAGRRQGQGQGQQGAAGAAGFREALVSELYSVAGLLLLAPRWVLQGQRLPSALAGAVPLPLLPAEMQRPVTGLVDRG
jgi:hypothetical protein